MKQSLLQKILKILPAEPAHRVRMALLRMVGALPLGRHILKWCLAPRNKELDREVFGVHFRNPIGIAAGFDANGDHLDELAAAGFGFVEIGSVVPYSQPGTPRPRLFRLRGTKSMVDNSGYPSRGMEYILDNIRHRPINKRELVIGCNIGKCTSTHKEDIAKEYLRVFRNMYQYVDFFVVNAACNTSSKRYVPRTREELLSLVEPMFEFRRGQLDYRPILLKISPDLTWEEIDTAVSVLIETPLDGIEAVAGSLTLATDDKGAISGEMLTERALEVVRYIAQKSEGNYPIIGCGGILTPDDAVRMMEAGASLVALNSGIRINGMHLLKHASKAIAEAKRTKA